jgi:hypothetical protein
MTKMLAYYATEFVTTVLRVTIQVPSLLAMAPHRGSTRVDLTMTRVNVCGSNKQASILGAKKL